MIFSKELSGNMTELEKLRVSLWNCIWYNAAIPESNKDSIHQAITKSLQEAYDLGINEQQS
jgi:hypothetical protein